MKIEEAKNKVCPMPKGGYCVAENCKMWIVHDNEYYPSTGETQSKYYPTGDCGLKVKHE